MALTDQLAADLNVFFNLDDFAEMHELAGRSLPCILDSEQAKQDTLRGVGGIYEADLLVYVREADVAGIELKPENPIVLDKRAYIITAVKPAVGIVELSLMQRRRQ